MSEKIHLDFKIPEDYAGRRLDQVLAKLLPDYSRAMIQSWVKSGQVKVDEQTARCKDKVKGLESISVQVELETASEAAPQDIPLNIVYEDKDVIVIDKTAGLVVHPGAGNPDGTIVNALLFHDDTLKHLPRAGIVHRLDKDTSGLMIIAKTISAHHYLVKAIQDRKVKRNYIALVNDTYITGATIDAPIGRHPRNRLKMAIVDSGKHAVTHFKIREKFIGHTLLNVTLETGRTHQIRLHFSSQQHPIVGDSLYGYRPRLPKQASEELKQSLKTFPRQALHAIKLSLAHPNTGEPMVFESEIPSDISDLLTLLRSHTTA